VVSTKAGARAGPPAPARRRRRQAEPTVSSSSPTSGFDRHASTYAEVWGEDPVARAMRRAVWRLIDALVAPDARVLDVGCGIGLDASWLLDGGRAVTCADASRGMVEAARARDPRLSPVLSSVQDLAAALGGPPGKGDVNSSAGFDAALLDFGVVNCLDPAGARAALAALALQLRPGGLLFLVSMPRLAPTWVAGRLARGDLRGALGRLRAQVAIPVEGEALWTHYWSAEALRRVARPWFRPVAQEGLGFLLPPPGSATAPTRVARLDALEAPLRRLPGLRSLGDHVALVLQRVQGAAPPPRPGPVRRRLSTRLAQRDGRHRRLPVLVLELTHGCQSRCGACDHRGPAGGEALDVGRAVALAEAARARGCEQVLLTGGEVLLRPDVEALLVGLSGVGLPLRLLSNGLLLERHAALLARAVQSVVISLDGGDPETYRRTRGVDGLARIGRGVRALRRLAPGMELSARVTVSALNAGRLDAVLDRALAWGLDGLSFLAADLASGEAFGRTGAADPALVPDPVALEAELRALRRRAPPGFVRDSDAAFARVWQKFAADLGRAPHRPPRCDAPWTSVVVGPDLSMKPCFFLPAAASAAAGLDAGLRAMEPALAALRVEEEPACARCVCWARLT
jgi:Fe-coproporphyrin III synthase